MSSIKDRLRKLSYANPQKEDSNEIMNKESPSDLKEISELQDKIKALHKLAYYDALTGLPNRRYFEEELIKRVEEHKNLRKPLAVMFIDMDRFKQINDTYGHDVGDELLKYVATKMLKVIGDLGFCARLAGDEFVALLFDFESKEELLFEARRLLMNLQPPIKVCLNDQEIELNSTPSIGISLYPDNGTSHEELLKSADEAMYEVKQNGKNSIKLRDYDPDSWN